MNHSSRWRPSIQAKELVSKKLAPAGYSHREIWLQSWEPGGRYSLHMWCSPTESAEDLHRCLCDTRHHRVTWIGTRTCRGWCRGASTGRLEWGAMTMGQRQLVQVCPKHRSHPTQDWRVCRWKRRIWWLSVTRSKRGVNFCFLERTHVTEPQHTELRDCPYQQYLLQKGKLCL